ncbi:sugar transferase [Exilibacterium tricleocarpae]|uniref:Sugar transferase n=1 Tax=Exilibacterium tricleocarpae TaxID=2591008 RepID=A0A545U461_9GAMM|nr:sugar transferase [Exilibacterium tricleocarpae]TQV84236.1 sugar transferase [Exilibacterium tricleocarpae]
MKNHHESVKNRRLVLRFLDLVLSLLGIILTIPIMAAILVLTFFDSGSPLFFQKRLGRHKKQFTLVKFRTMRIGTPSIGTHLVPATSTTKLGNLLRKSKLDELPQLFNVLLGHMSLVGPRPGLPSQIQLTLEREKRGVFDVRPGITGLAQVKNIDMSTPKKLAIYDSIMITKLNILLYVRIISTTALGRGAGDKITPTRGQL